MTTTTIPTSTLAPCVSSRLGAPPSAESYVGGNAMLWEQQKAGRNTRSERGERTHNQVLPRALHLCLSTPVHIAGPCLCLCLCLCPCPCQCLHLCLFLHLHLPSATRTYHVYLAEINAFAFVSYAYAFTCTCHLYLYLNICTNSDSVHLLAIYLRLFTCDFE
jgi:hypothetical protein